MRERAFQTYLEKYPGIGLSFPKVATGGARIWSIVDDPSKPLMSQFNFSPEVPKLFSVHSAFNILMIFFPSTTRPKEIT